MKKYKLIKEYPGTKELLLSSGYEVECLDTQYYMSSKIRPLGIPKSWVENNPEFWEEVKEKEWEIIELRRVDGSDHTNEKRKIEIYLRGLEHGINIFWFIHSIKRQSDGEVFAVGDYITSTYYPDNRPTELSSIELYENSRIMLKTKFLSFTRISIKNAVKAKKLFTTEDGVDIFKGQFCWCLLDRNSFKGNMILEERQCNGTAKEGKYFSTKKAAQDYISSKMDLWYGMNLDTFEVIQIPVAFTFLESYGSRVGWFKTTEERDNFTKANKPMYTERDMMSFAKYVGSKMEFTNPQKMFKDWKGQVK